MRDEKKQQKKTKRMEEHRNEEEPYVFTSNDEKSNDSVQLGSMSGGEVDESEGKCDKYL